MGTRQRRAAHTEHDDSKRTKRGTEEPVEVAAKRRSKAGAPAEKKAEPARPPTRTKGRRSAPEAPAKPAPSGAAADAKTRRPTKGYLKPQTQTFKPSVEPKLTPDMLRFQKMLVGKLDAWIASMPEEQKNITIVATAGTGRGMTALDIQRSIVKRTPAGRRLVKNLYETTHRVALEMVMGKTFSLDDFEGVA